MRFEFARSKIQCTVFAVEQIRVMVEKTVRHRIYRFCILNHGTAVLSHLQLLHELNVAVAGILILDLKCKSIQPVCQLLCQFSNRKGVLVRSPDRTVIDIPDTAFPVKPCDRLIVIRKGIADAAIKAAFVTMQNKLIFSYKQILSPYLGGKNG